MTGSSRLTEVTTFTQLLSDRLETSRARVIPDARYDGASDSLPDAILIAIELRPEFVGKVDPNTDGMHQENEVLWAISRASDENFWWDDLIVGAPYCTGATYAVWYVNDTPAIDRVLAAVETVPVITDAERAQALNEIGVVV